MWRWDQAEPFCNNPADEDPDANSVAFDLPLRLPGQRYDQETGLHYNYFRDYDSSLGIYKQSDMIGLGGGLNTYAYVGSSPLRATDPTGEFALVGAAALVAIGAGYYAFQGIWNTGEAVADLHNATQRAIELRKEIEKAWEACQCGDRSACKTYVDLKKEYDALPGIATNAGAQVSDVPGVGPLPGEVGKAAGQLYRSR